jgi:hypothetical protein
MATAVVSTRSADVPSILDAHAVEHVGAMVEQGWTASAAASAWQDHVETLAEAAHDLAIAEVAWETGG